ncbi:hypothetical protein TNCV_4624211 [Trichonephila clavipes]|nr:hypothetical protein TNCV_4624211 [Trichonephila clavipes]
MIQLKKFEERWQLGVVLVTLPGRTLRYASQTALTINKNQVPSNTSTLNSRRATSPLVRLMEGEREEGGP